MLILCCWHSTLRKIHLNQAKFFEEYRDGYKTQGEGFNYGLPKIDLNSPQLHLQRVKQMNAIHSEKRAL